RLAIDDDLTLCVDDNGVGLSGGYECGLGTVSMQERAAELGGSLRFGRSPLGGAQVVARLPTCDSHSTHEARTSSTRSLA
ncbi:MAG: hypothetical protein KDB26_11370, partial [Microthrixaceae bacterium]|nr:hypothetical protein [Microthrixaceae bacterium]